MPYFTAARQTTVVAGEGAEIQPIAIRNGTFLSASRLFEGGLKGEFLNKRLYVAVSAYSQERTDVVSDSPLTNQVIKTRGVEAELRWSVDRHLLVSANYTYIDVINAAALNAGLNPNPISGSGLFQLFRHRRPGQRACEPSLSVPGRKRNR